MSDELKACPFCGRIPKTSHRPESEAIGGGHVAFVVCYCGGYASTAHQMGHAETVQAAIAEVVEKWNARAQLPSQGGEAVEVVAYGDKQQLNALKSECSASCAVWNSPGRNREPLMTVAQHQCILAASVGSAEPVAMKTHGAWDGLDDLANLPDGTKLYTHPADQVAEPDAELVNLLQRASLVMGEAAIRIRHGDDQSCEAKALVEQLASGMQVISAKLATIRP
jgi:hypothetical protein